MSTATRPYTVEWFRRLVIDQWREWRLGGDPPRSLRILQVSAGNWHVGQRRVTWLAFDEPKPDPIVACKCSLGGRSHTLAHEHESLRRLRDAGSALGFEVAEPLEFVDDAHATLLVQGAVTGAPLHAHPARGRYGSDEEAAAHGFELAARVSEGLAGLAESGEMIDAIRHPLVERLLDRLGALDERHGFGDAKVSVGGVRQMLEGIRVPTRHVVHGDLTGDHIRLEGDRCTVIDWEMYTERGLPFGDLVQYGLTLGQYFKIARPERVTDALLAGEGQSMLPAAVRAAAHRVGERLRVEGQDERDWLALAMLDVVIAWKWSAFEGGARDPDCSAIVDRALRQLQRSR